MACWQENRTLADPKLARKGTLPQELLDLPIKGILVRREKNTPDYSVVAAIQAATLSITPWQVLGAFLSVRGRDQPLPSASIAAKRAWMLELREAWSSAVAFS